MLIPRLRVRDDGELYEFVPIDLPRPVKNRKRRKKKLNRAHGDERRFGRRMIEKLQVSFYNVESRAQRLLQHVFISHQL